MVRLSKLVKTFGDPMNESVYPGIEGPARGRPLPHLMGGAAIAFAALAALLYFAYHGWISGDLSRDAAYTGIGVMFPAFAGGTFLFSYGWERGDAGKAIKLTLKVCIGALLALLALLAIAALASRAKAGAAGAGKAASSPGFDGAPLIRAFRSLLGDGSEGLDDAGAPRRASGSEARDAVQPFTIACPGCRVRFTPQPPRAVCPNCKQAALPA